MTRRLHCDFGLAIEGVPARPQRLGDALEKM